MVAGFLGLDPDTLSAESEREMEDGVGYAVRRTAGRQLNALGPVSKCVETVCS